jgi:AcrR family transcriptional regulator
MVKSRVSKDPEIRKSEIIDAATELFLTKGLEETSISDIVHRVGVAQGLFYYYFKSKDEILNEVVERLAAAYFAQIERINKQPGLNALEKLQFILKKMVSLVAENEELILYFHEKQNEVFHHRAEHKFLDYIIVIFTDLIEQGIREKIFTVEYPLETAEIMMTGMSRMPSMFKEGQNLEHVYRKFAASLSILEKVLGVPKGSLQYNLIPPPRGKS